MKVGIYTITYEGLYYDDRHLTIPEIIDRAGKYGYDGIEIEARKPHAFPLSLNKKKREEIRQYAASKNIEIAALAANNDFTNPVLDRRESEMVMVSEIIRLARDLGAKLVRIFTDWKGFMLDVRGKAQYDIPEDPRFQLPCSRFQRWNWCRECIEEVAKVAEDCGVVLALQNHGPLIRDCYDMLNMVGEVDSEYVKCSLDPSGSGLRGRDDRYVAQVVRDTGELIVHSHITGEFEKVDGRLVSKQFDVVHFNQLMPVPSHKIFIKTLKEIGYEGYLSYELCHPFLSMADRKAPREKRPTRMVSYKLASLKEVDEQVRYVLEYVKSLIEVH